MYQGVCKWLGRTHREGRDRRPPLCARPPAVTSAGANPRYLRVGFDAKLAEAAAPAYLPASHDARELGTCDAEVPSRRYRFLPGWLVL